MKINWNRKYNTYAAYACIVGAALTFVIFLGIYFKGVLSFLGMLFDVVAPIVYGAVIAYILNPITKVFENKAFKKMRFRRTRRGISMAISYLIVFAVVALLGYALIPEIARSFSDLQSNLILYASSLDEWVNEISASSPQFKALLRSLLDYIDVDSVSDSLSKLFESMSGILAEFSPFILSFVNSFMVQLRNIILGLIFSAYFLASKELVFAQIRKLLHSLLSDERYKKFSGFVRFSDHTFGRYLLGTVVDSAMVGCVFLALLTIFKFPYAPLVSIVCGFTNMIPIFGPFIGAIPSFFIILISDPIKALWFVLIVLLVQQIDGNVIAPRILGESTGLSAIAVISAVTIMGGIFGVVGMVIGVPMCAVFANIINRKTDEKIEARERNRHNADSAHNADGDYPEHLGRTELGLDRENENNRKTDGEVSEDTDISEAKKEESTVKKPDETTDSDLSDTPVPAECVALGEVCGASERYEADPCEGDTDSEQNGTDTDGEATDGEATDGEA
ncbi:MAG: AI-2E family transporter, partial [Clostridia bacterium]|nr:AI-2E family transporter [Clostridia bacterium]